MALCRVGRATQFGLLLVGGIVLAAGCDAEKHWEYVRKKYNSTEAADVGANVLGADGWECAFDSNSYALWCKRLGKTRRSLEVIEAELSASLKENAQTEAESTAKTVEMMRLVERRREQRRTLAAGGSGETAAPGSPASTAPAGSAGGDHGKSCPQMVGEPKYSFYWGMSRAKKKVLYLKSDFLRQVSFSGGYKLSQKPDREDYFFCEQGSSVGESRNKLYCRALSGKVWGEFKFNLERSAVGQDGTIQKKEEKLVRRLVFDLEGKSLDPLSALARLKLEPLKCH